MKNFLKENKNTLKIIIIVLLLLAIIPAFYFFSQNQEVVITKDEPEQTVTQEEEENSGAPEYDLFSSSKAISATSASAEKWAADSKLYDCTGIPTSVTIEDRTYTNIGAESGQYYKWLCTYYSKSEGATKIIVFENRRIFDNAEPVDIGEYADLNYDSIEYPTDVTRIVDSTEIYANAKTEGLNDENYVNMYLKDVGDYGFVWKLEERSQTDKDEYGIGLIQNTYLFDIYSGELITKSTEEIR